MLSYTIRMKNTQKGSATVVLLIIGLIAVLVIGGYITQKKTVKTNLAKSNFLTNEDLKGGGIFSVISVSSTIYYSQKTETLVSFFVQFINDSGVSELKIPKDTHIKLIDSSGNTYSPEINPIGNIDHVRPHQTLMQSILFSVPNKTDTYTLHIEGLEFKDKKNLDLKVGPLTPNKG
jgi:hypothetical protein